MSDDMGTQLRARVQTSESVEETVRWLESQGIAEIDARRMVQLAYLQTHGGVPQGVAL